MVFSKTLAWYIVRINVGLCFLKETKVTDSILMCVVNFLTHRETKRLLDIDYSELNV